MQRNKAFFFDSPRTTAGTKFNANNIPSENTFRDLMDSIPFKVSSGDYATETLQGLVTLATTAVSKARSGNGVVLPSHLPALQVNGTELISSNSSYQGIKVTAISATDRLDYQIDFDPTSLTAKTTLAATDFLVIVDTADSGKPKKLLYSALSGSVWKDTATVITPVTSGDSLDMGTGPVTAASYLLTYAADAYINPKTSTGNNGSNLHFVGGAGLDPSNPKTGGSAYIYGGAGVNGGLNGSTLICYDGTTWRGRLGIGGAADSAYLVKISGDLWVTGTFKYDATPGGGGGAGAGAGAMIMNSSGEVISPTFKQLMDAVVGSTVTAKSVLWFNGTSYSAIALGASSDKYLRVNSSLDLEVADLVLTGKVVDASVSAGAALSWSKMATLATSTIPALDAGGLMVSSGVAAGKLTYLTNVSSDIQGQLDAVVRNVISSNIIIANTVFTDANLPNQITLDTTGGSKTATLPLISTLTDGTVVELSQYGANTGTIAKNAGDTVFVDKTGADVATLVLSGAGGYAKLRCDHATSSWYVLAWI